MKKVTKEVSRFTYTPHPEGRQFWLGQPSESDVMDAVLEIAHTNYPLKVYKHLVDSKTVFDKTKPIAYHLFRYKSKYGGSSAWFVKEKVDERVWEISSETEPLIVYPTTIIYTVKVYLQ